MNGSFCFLYFISRGQIAGGYREVFRRQPSRWLEHGGLRDRHGVLDNSDRAFQKRILRYVPRMRRPCRSSNRDACVRYLVRNRGTRRLVPCDLSRFTARNNSVSFALFNPRRWNIEDPKFTATSEELSSSVIKQDEAAWVPKTEERDLLTDACKPEVRETNEEKQVEKLVLLEKRVEVCWGKCRGEGVHMDHSFCFDENTY